MSRGIQNTWNKARRHLGLQNDPQFFWQPMQEHPPIAPFIRKVRLRLELEHDLGSAIDQSGYLDWNHTTSEGNAKIAKAIAQAISGHPMSSQRQPAERHQ